MKCCFHQMKTSSLTIIKTWDTPWYASTLCWLVIQYCNGVVFHHSYKPVPTFYLSNWHNVPCDHLHLCTSYVMPLEDQLHLTCVVFRSFSWSVTEAAGLLLQWPLKSSENVDMNMYKTLEISVYLNTQNWFLWSLANSVFSGTIYWFKNVYTYYKYIVIYCHNCFQWTHMVICYFSYNLVIKSWIDCYRYLCIVFFYSSEGLC